MEIPEGHFRHILIFYFRKGKNAEQAHRKLCGFRSGNIDVKDEPRPGRPNFEKVDEIL